MTKDSMELTKEKLKPSAAKVAAVAGSSGAVGRKLLEQLLENDQYSEVHTAVRRPSNMQHPKLHEHLVDFEAPQSLIGFVAAADELFCCLGTTLKIAGSKPAFKRVDYHYVTQLAELAARHNVERFLVVSAMGANPESKVFYNRVKGEMEQAVSTKGLPAVDIFRPSLLLGERDEFRAGEAAGKLAMKLVNPLLVGASRDYRGIHPERVADAMVEATASGRSGVNIHQLGKYA